MAVPLLGNHASREFATQNPRPRYYDEFCAICGSKQLYTHDWGIERNAPLQSFASAVQWARFRPMPETASGRTARWRWRAPKGWAFGRPSLELDLGRTVLSGLRMGPNFTVVLPYGARMLAPNELRAKLGGECPYWFLQRVLERLLSDGPS